MPSRCCTTCGFKRSIAADWVPCPVCGESNKENAVEGPSILSKSTLRLPPGPAADVVAICRAPPFEGGFADSELHELLQLVPQQRERRLRALGALGLHDTASHGASSNGGYISSLSQCYRVQ
ncbi:unnamed protein product, partial [Phaeothamnion confervicola]